MDDFDVARVVDEFWRERARGVFFPPQWFGRLTLDQGYGVQLGLLERRVAAGARLIGWKVGLTSEAMQQQFRVPEPLFGYLLDDAPHASPARFARDALIQPGVENEICLTLAADLVGPGVDLAAARRAVGAVAPAIEVAETRGDFTAQLPVAVADNIQERYIVLGTPTAPLPTDLDLAAVRATVEINGARVAEATGAAVLGDPLRALVWLANKLPEYGQAVRAGQLVMTGSVTRQFAVERGDRVVTTFAPLGVVAATFD
jgi:2-keto-4-pentenoate hydratase